MRVRRSDASSLQAARSSPGGMWASHPAQTFRRGLLPWLHSWALWVLSFVQTWDGGFLRRSNFIPLPSSLGLKRRSPQPRECLHFLEAGTRRRQPGPWRRLGVAQGRRSAPGCGAEVVPELIKPPGTENESSKKPRSRYSKQAFSLLKQSTASS